MRFLVCRRAIFRGIGRNLLILGLPPVWCDLAGRELLYYVITRHKPLIHKTFRRSYAPAR